MDNQQRFQDTGSQDRYQQSGLDASDPNYNQSSTGYDQTSTGYDQSSTGYDQSSTGAGYGDNNTGATQQYGDPDNRSTGAYPTRASAPGTGFDNNAPNYSDTSGGYNDPSSGGGYGTGTSGGDYATGNTGIDDTSGDAAINKPSAGDKMRGSAEKMIGKVTKNPNMQERGQERKTGNMNDY